MKIFPFLLVLLFVFSSFTFNSKIAPIAGNTDPVEKIVLMKVKEAEKILGRKMSFKEKIGFKLAQHKIKKEQKKKEERKNTPGQDAFIVSLIAICSIVIPYVGIVAFPLAIVGLIMGINAKKKDPADKKANIAIILSIVTLGLFVLAAIVLALIIAAFTI